MACRSSDRSPRGPLTVYLDHDVGGLYDRGTGWIKYGQRWYNPTTGRFTQQDSIERLADPEQGNRYAYAADNPVNYTDPTGQSFLGCLGSVVGAAGALVLFGVAVFPTGPAGWVAAGVIGTGLVSLSMDILVVDQCF
jgi:RHS repeat-associated protein